MYYYMCNVYVQVMCIYGSLVICNLQMYCKICGAITKIWEESLELLENLIFPNWWKKTTDSDSNKMMDNSALIETA